MKSLHKYIQLNKKETQILPCLVSVEAKEELDDDIIEKNRQ